MARMTMGDWGMLATCAACFLYGLAIGAGDGPWFLWAIGAAGVLTVAAILSLSAARDERRDEAAAMRAEIHRLRRAAGEA